MFVGDLRLTGEIHAGSFLRRDFQAALLMMHPVSSNYSHVFFDDVKKVERWFYMKISSGRYRIPGRNTEYKISCLWNDISLSAISISVYYCCGEKLNEGQNNSIIEKFSLTIGARLL